jgi:hypothetical protein
MPVPMCSNNLMLGPGVCLQSAGRASQYPVHVTCRRRSHQILAMRAHLPALDHGGMDAASARYMIRINGHLGATLLSAFPAMAWQREGPETVLTGVLDRPRLYGVLAEIEALGLDLLEVRQLTPEARSPGRGDTCSP